MNQLIIVGAGGFGREVAHWVTQNPGNGLEFNIRGFLDDNTKALANFRNYPPIIGTIEDYIPEPTDIFICGIGLPEQKAKAIPQIIAKGGRFMNLIHPSVVFGGNIKLGSVVVIAPHVTISADATISDFATIDSNSVIGHDVKLGQFCHIGNLCSITGGVEIGVQAFIGVHSVILPKLKIGEGSIVGAGSVVTKHVAPNNTVYGNPAIEAKK